MTDAEYRTQVSLWAIGASPLILQADPAKAPPAIVANPKVIAVDQDALGVQGRFVTSDGWYHVLSKPLANGDQAILLFNESDRAATISTRLKPARYRAEELWTGAVTSTGGDLAAQVPAHGSVLYRVSVSREQAPPAVLVEADPAGAPGEDHLSVLVPGVEREVVTRVTNTGGTDRLRDVEVALAVPQGWRAKARTATRTGRLDGGETFTVKWAVTPPAGAELKDYEITATAAKTAATAVVKVARAPGSGRTYLSDLPWTRVAQLLRPGREGHQQRREGRRRRQADHHRGGPVRQGARYPRARRHRVLHRRPLLDRRVPGRHRRRGGRGRVGRSRSLGRRRPRRPLGHRHRRAAGQEGHRVGEGRHVRPAGRDQRRRQRHLRPCRLRRRLHNLPVGRELMIVPKPVRYEVRQGWFVLDRDTASDRGAGAGGSRLLVAGRAEPGHRLLAAAGAGRERSLSGSTTICHPRLPAECGRRRRGDRGRRPGRGVLRGADAAAAAPGRRVQEGPAGGPLVLPAVRITDAPRFGWRGCMLDVARHFLPTPTCCASST